MHNRVPMVSAPSASTSRFSVRTATVSASVPNIIGTTGPRGTNDLKLATGFLKINIEDKDPPGRYQVRVVVHDGIRNVSIPLEAGVVVIESGSGR